MWPYFSFDLQWESLPRYLLNDKKSRWMNWIIDTYTGPIEASGATGTSTQREDPPNLV